MPSPGLTFILHPLHFLLYNPRSYLVSSEGIHNEKELLLQIAQGDRNAFKVLYTAYFPHVQQYVSLFESGRESLDELTQDVFVRIWEKRARLAGVESFKGYVFLITRNVVFNFIRALKIRQKVQELN